MQETKSSEFLFMYAAFLRIGLNVWERWDWVYKSTKLCE